VTVIDGRDNSTTTVAAGSGPYAVAVNPVTSKIYVANYDGDNVTVIDGGDNSTATVAAGDGPSAVGVNPVTNKIYVANEDGGNVTVIDGTNNTTTTVAAGTSPRAVAVDPVTNKIYVANYLGANVTVIDGIGNSATATVPAGTNPRGAAVNPVTGRVYVANRGSDDVTVITPARTESIPLTTDITPLAGDATVLARPIFTLSATSTFSPTISTIGHMYYQVDTWTGPWLETNPAGASGSGQTPTLLPGTHLLFAFAADGEEATSINIGQGSSPVIGEISAYHFLMKGMPSFLPLALKRY
jgi:YVTN family beta-propeller protein